MAVEWLPLFFSSPHDKDPLRDELKAPGLNILYNRLPNLGAKRIQFDDELLGLMRQSAERGIPVNVTIYLNLPDQLASLAKEKPNISLFYSPMQTSANYYLVDDGRGFLQEARDKFFGLTNSIFTGPKANNLINGWPRCKIDPEDIDWVSQQIRVCEDITREYSSVEKLHEMRVHPVDIYNELMRKSAERSSMNS